MFSRGFSFRIKLFVSFMLVSLLPVIIVQIVSYYMASEAMKTKVDVLVHANLLQTSKNLDTSMLAYDDIVMQIITNDEVIRLVGDINGNQTDLELSRRKLINLLAGYSYAKSGIRSVAVLTSNATLISYDRQTGSPYDSIWSGKPITELALYEQAMNTPGTVITEPEAIESINNVEQYGFHLARKLTDYNKLDLEGIGIVVITVYESVLAQAINLADGSSASEFIPNHNYLVNAHGRIVSSTDKKTIGEEIATAVRDSTIVNTYINETSGLLLYNLVDENDMFKEMFAMRRLIIITACLAIFVSIMLILYFSGRLSRSIRDVVRAMKLAQQGALDVQIPNPDSKDEISHIAFSFNKMMSTITELMNETKLAIEKQKEAEIRALEAQINPHFLYNTLDSINWLAIEKDEHQISQMLKGLAQILRYSIKDSNKRVQLSEELGWMQKYTYLQQFRFRSSFRCEIRCPDELLQLAVPKLLLQPLIENAILHGFEGVKEGGLLEIDIAQSEHRMLSICISDNGTGMDKLKQQAVLTGSTGIGLRNVKDRLNIYYGRSADIRVSSTEGLGTKVWLTLPIIHYSEEMV